MSTLEFDELNEFQKYFLPMEITDEQKQKREELANAIYDAMLFFFSAIKVYLKNGNYTQEYFNKMLYDKLIDTVVKHTGTDSVLQNYLENLSNDIITVTFDRLHLNSSANGAVNSALIEEGNLDGNYWLSDMRAFNIAVNETNTILNYSEYLEAIEGGMTKKKWVTMRDERVRTTHIELDDVEIDIEDVFYVGGSIMRYPRDFEYGADLEEILGCRCSLIYS